ncbi:MAG TPA: DUF4249 family protein, partial [Bacteroidales bacterium]|nr:DUF4249 family protein [Bacteroidales bacterium]
MTKILSSSIIILLLFSACVEPYTPVIESNIESALVVDALITNDYAVQWVRLSNASPLDKPDFHPLNNATVSVEDDLGERIIFIFRKDGLYTPDNFAGEAGRSYKLLIDMNNGKHYESDYQSLKTVNPFDSVYYSLTEQPTTDPAVNIDGAQFFLDFPSQRDTDTYYIYHLEETYEYNTDLRLYLIDKGESLQKA